MDSERTGVVKREDDAKRDVIDEKTKSEDSEVAYGRFIYMWT